MNFCAICEVEPVLDSVRVETPELMETAESLVGQYRNIYLGWLRRWGIEIYFQTGVLETMSESYNRHATLEEKKVLDKYKHLSRVSFNCAKTRACGDCPLFPKELLDLDHEDNQPKTTD